MRVSRICLTLIGAVLFAGVAAAATGPFQPVNQTWFGGWPLTIWQGAGGDVFVGGTGDILHFDGARWNRQPPPLDCTTFGGGNCGQLSGLWGAARDDVFGLSPWGIAHFDGHAWSLMELPWKIEDPAHVSYASGVLEDHMIWGSAGSDVYAVAGRPGIPPDTGRAVLLHYDGTSWSEVVLTYPGMTAPFQPIGVTGTSAGDVFVGGKGKILHFDGTAWSISLTHADPELRFQQIQPTHAGGVFASGEKWDPVTHYWVSVLMYFDGTNWAVRGDAPLANPMIAGATGLDVYFRDGRNGGDAIQTLTRFSAAGWSALPASRVRYVRGRSFDDCYGYGSQAIYRFDGNAWTPVESLNYKPVKAFSARDVFAIGYPETVVHYDGAEWTTMSTPLMTGVTDLWGSSGNDVFVLGGAITYQEVSPGNVVPQFHDAVHFDGTAWTPMDMADGLGAVAIWGAGPHDVFAVGGESADTWCPDPEGGCWETRGAIQHYDGSVWSKMTAPPGCDGWPPVYIHRVWGSSGSDVFALGQCHYDKRLLLHYDGTAWTPMDTPDNYSRYGIGGTAGNDVLVYGQRRDGAGDLQDLYLHYDGTAWSAAPAGAASPAFDPSTMSWTDASADLAALGPCASDLRCWGKVIGWDVGWPLGPSATDLYTWTEYPLGQYPILHYGPPGPAQLAAGDGAPGGNVAVSWDAVAGATAYQLYRSPRGITDFRMLAAVGPADTAYGDALGCGSLGYDYKVAAVFADGSLSAFSPTDLGFTGGCDVPATPMLVSPSTLIWTLWPRFVWKAQRGTASYQLKVGQGTITAFAGWFSAEQAGCGGGNWECSVSLPEPLADGRWQFTVQGANDKGTGPWAAAGVFDISTVPTALTLFTPSTGQVIPESPGGTRFTWKAQPGVQSYQLWVGSGTSTAVSRWVTPAEVYCEELWGGCQLLVTPGLPAGAWFYNVRGRNAKGTGPWTASLRFVVGAPPAAPILLSPSGMIGTASPAFQWQAVAGADGYQLWVGTDTAMAAYTLLTPAAAGCGSGTGTCSGTLAAPLEAGIWFFNVKARNAVGFGPWAAPVLFTHAPAGVPAQSTLLGPSGVIATVSPTFTWSAQEGVESYNLWVGTGASTVYSLWFTAAAAGCGAGTGTCAVTPATPLGEGAWHFNVRGRNLAGTGPWAGAGPFAVSLAGPPAAVTPLGPAGAAGTGTPTFTWASQSGVDSYQLWVGTGASTAYSVWYSAAAAGCASGVRAASHRRVRSPEEPGSSTCGAGTSPASGPGRPRRASARPSGRRSEAAQAEVPRHEVAQPEDRHHHRGELGVASARAVLAEHAVADLGHETEKR